MSKPVLPKDWGRDHFSTLLYVGCVVCADAGKPNNTRMRCNIERHPHLYHPAMGYNPKSYPTRLRDDVELHDHDDWDCVDDLAAASFVELSGTGLQPVWGLTDRGWSLFQKLVELKNKFVPISQITWEKIGKPNDL